MSAQVHWVYRLFSDNRDLLYVGCTSDIDTRIETHAREKPWWGEVASIRTVEYPSGGAGFAAEGDAIRDEQPRYNRSSGHGHRMATRTFRVSDAIYSDAVRGAESTGVGLSQLVRESLAAYSDRPGLPLSGHVEQGLCLACGQELLRTATDCWHPWDSSEIPCPPTERVYGVLRVQTGDGVGRPGRDCFIPANASEVALSAALRDRIPDDVYEAAQRRAAERGETVTDVVLRALKRYGKDA